MARVLFWLSAAVIGWVYAGYPVAAAISGRWRPFRLRTDGPGPAVVTVGIAIHDEAKEIESRVANVLEQDLDAELEIIVASDGSTDGSDEIVERLGAADPRVHLLRLSRGGQTASQNALVAEASGDVIVLTDAETRFEPGCLRALVRPFADRRVGCTTGVLEWRNRSDSRTTRHEGFYWRYEQAVRSAETRAGWLTAVTGALLAVRRDLVEAVPTHSSFDHIVPLQVRAAGKVVLAVPEARATDRVVSRLRNQFHDRSRTATRGIGANLSMAGRLAPWRHPTAALAIWSHKLLRWGSPWAALAGTAAAARLVSKGQNAYAVPLAMSMALPVMAATEFVARRAGRRGTRLGSAALAATVVNAAFLRGWINLVGRRRITIWHRQDWRAE
ncbi:MAG: glycosyltransferase [Chloroflexi bacterium]|nr:glycosyltransferase [Chloroflexota bacterium]